MTTAILIAIIYTLGIGWAIDRMCLLARIAQITAEHRDQRRKLAAGGIEVHRRQRAKVHARMNWMRGHLGMEMIP